MHVQFAFKGAMDGAFVGDLDQLGALFFIKFIAADIDHAV
jgi:hypothetical protein